MSEPLRGPTLGAYRWADIVFRFGARLPAYPAFGTVVPIARVPEPPQLLASDEENTRALHLALAYRAVVTRFYDSPAFASLSDEDEVERERCYENLILASDALLTAHIAPMSWVALSVDVHIQYGRRSRPPGVVWVFSLERIEERKDWLAWAEQKFRGGRLIVEPEHRELVVSYERMRYALMLISPLTEAKVDRIVQSHLSQKKYNDLLRTIDRKVEVKQRELRRAMQRREWIW